jgi:hypothetical protein
MLFFLLLHVLLCDLWCAVAVNACFCFYMHDMYNIVAQTHVQQISFPFSSAYGQYSQ